MPRKISEVVKTKDEQIEHLRAKSRQKEEENSRLRERLGSQAELRQALENSVKATDPYPRFRYSHPKKTTSGVTAALLLSDWQLGELIRPQETEGFGEFNSEIAERRIAEIAERFLGWVNTQRAGYRIDNCDVWGIGDYVSGEIHDELRETAELTTPQATAKAGYLLGETLARLATNFQRLTFHGVGADNHGRLTRKPRAKRKATDNFSYLVHYIARLILKRHTNVNFIEAEGMKYTCQVNGFRFLAEHGDTVRAWMGLPWYGLEREQAREARRRMNTNIGFHYQLIGHWHCPGWIPGSNIIVNGSLSGTSEYDHACGRHSPPAQVAFLVHPKHGVFNLVPFRVA